MNKKSKKTSAGHIDDFVAIIRTGDMDAICSYMVNRPRDIVMARDADGRNALYHAIFTDNVKIVRALIEYGFNPADIDNKTGATALHLAASEGHWEIACHLVADMNMDVNVLDNVGRNPLFYTLINFENSNDAPVIALMLIDYGARFQAQMHTMGTAMADLMSLVLSDIHRICESRDESARPRIRRNVKFMIDALNEYNSLFFNDDVAVKKSSRTSPRKKK